MNAIRYQVRDGIAEILMDNPPVNALTVGLLDQLLQAFERARDDDSARVVILASAAPGMFCAGLDLKVLAEASAESIHDVLERLYTRMTEAQHHLGKPSIAAVAGAARGGGMTLAISCDLIVAERNATFGYPEIDVGLIPAIHFTHLPGIIGKHRAFDLLFTGRSFQAQQAYEMGLVSRVVEPGAALQGARELARVLADKPPQVMRLARNAFQREFNPDYRRGVAAAVQNFCHGAVTQQAREGMRAFAQKRPAAWRRRG
jgi:enoyl-CoA hydratase